MTLPVNRSEPVNIRAGDSAQWSLALADFPASGGWTLTYTLVKSGAKITIPSAADGDEHAVSLPAATTAAWAPGVYAWQARVTSGTDAYTVRTGSLEILENFAALADGGMDTRSHAKRTLDALEAWIEGRALGVAEYEIAGRKMKYIPIADLLLLRDRYRREVRAQSGANGRSGRIYVRF